MKSRPIPTPPTSAIVIAAIVVAASIGASFGAPFPYKVNTDGNAPANFVANVEKAFKAWQGVTGTSLKTNRLETTAPTTFSWGEGDVPINPDLATRTLIRSGENQSSEVRVNPETADLESALLIETGLRLGLDLDPNLGEKRVFGETETKAVRARFSQTGDLNGDGKINLDDLELLALNFGKRAPTGGTLTGDLNGDGIVNQQDMDILKANYGFEPITQPAAENPAPASPAPASPANPADPKTSPATPSPGPTTPPKRIPES
jgi:Dockerin type I domain